MMILNPYRFAAAGGGSGPEWLSSTGSVTANAFGSSLAVQMPAAVDSGDLLVMHATNGNAEERTFSTPSGWTALGSFVVNSTLGSQIFYKIADGTEGGTTVTLSASGTCHIAAIASRIKVGTFDAATPIARATPASGSMSQPDSPSFAPAWGSATTLWFSSIVFNKVLDINVVTWPYTDGRTEINNASSGGGVVGAKSCVAVVSAASEDPPAWVISANLNLWIAETIAIKPA